MTKHFEPGQIVLINTADPISSEKGAPAENARGAYVRRDRPDLEVPFPHVVEFEGDHLYLADEEVSA